MSSWKASHSDEQPPAEPPVAPMRFGSMFHSVAFDRTNCTARAASSSGAFTGGVTFCSLACRMSR